MNRQQRRAAAKAATSSKPSPTTLLEAGARYLQSGQFSEAEKCCREILADDPDHADSFHLLGLISAETNKGDQAIEFFAEAVRKNPNNADFFSNLGTMLQLQDRLEEALKNFELALSLKPDSSNAWIKLGHVLQRQKRFEEALLAYDHALTLDPPHTKAEKDLSQAEAFYRRGDCLQDLKRFEEAYINYSKALTIDPDNHEAFHNRALTLLEMQRADEALMDFRKAIEIEPNSAVALNGCAHALLRLKRYEEALTTLDRALSISPDWAILFLNRGVALKGLVRLNEALAHYDRAIALKPDNAQAYSNRGHCLDDMGRYDEALSSYKDALALQPDHPDAHWNIGITSLRTGDLKTGWVGYEWRWKTSSFQARHRHFTQPLWLGAEPIDGKVLLLYNEQGLGDAIQFCRYVPLVAARGARVILEVDGPLKELLSGMPGVSHYIAKGETLPDFDFHCPLISLPLVFDTTLDTIPSAVPYLSVGAHATDRGTRLDSKKRPRIGLVWSGNPDHRNDRNRSIPLEALLPLLDVEAQFVSLQKIVRPRDEALLRERSDVLHLGPELQSFSDTAALIEQLDLVISVDTSVAHLAGALGCPVWILLPHVPDWRWLLDRDDSPWYPTVRLFRQSQTCEWGSVVDEVHRALILQQAAMSLERRATAKTATSSKPSPAALLEAGARYLQSGQFAEAEECCRQILADDPDHADSFHLLGLISAGTNRGDQAIEFFAEAIRKNPSKAEYFSNLGTMLEHQDRFEEALKSFDLALSLEPDSSATWIKIGYVLQRQKRFEEALLVYDHALKLDPPHTGAEKNLSQADALCKRGVCLRHLMRLEEACISYGKALTIDPDYVDALNHRGIALILLRRSEEALTNIDHALSISPDSAELFNNKGNALKAIGRFDEALAHYDRAIALKPDYAQAYSNRGSCLDEMGRYDEALSGYKDALALQSDHPDAHWNIAITSLRTGDLKTGWVEHEWRWKTSSFQARHRHFTQPLWLGAEPIDGKVLLLHNEQGFGDAIQFCRYVPLVAARGARVVLEIDGPLKELLSGMPGVSHYIAKGETLPDFDFHCPLASLPLAFDTTLDTIPSETPYLSVGVHATDWKLRFDSEKRPRIGLVWSGNPDHGNDHNRSIPLKSLLPLLDVEAQFVSLQKNIRPSDEAVLREKSDILHLGPELQSFSDTAALIEQLDLVISVDTSVAHLAGALGRPVWILLPHVPDWRWLLDRDDSPWYPTARLFRQSQTREWDSVVDQARQALKHGRTFGGESGAGISR